MDAQEVTGILSRKVDARGGLFELLKQQRRIDLISCRTRLPRLVEAVLGTSVRYARIHEIFQNLPPDCPIPDYVVQLESVSERQFVEFPGMAWFVGAGLYGKLDCNLIKSQGGIALDLGAQFDAWLGIASRPMVYRSLFQCPADEDGVPPEIVLTAENVRRLQRLRGGSEWK